MFWNERLKEERKRLKIKQRDLAADFGVVRQTILGYEKGKTNPDIDFFVKLAPYGFDVQYILTGVRSQNCLSDEIKELIKLYEQAPDNIKQAAKAVLLSGNVPKVSFINNKVLNSNIKIS